MYIGYARISTNKQLDGNGLEAQVQELEGKYPDVTIYKEQYSGKTTDRPIFNSVMAKLKEGDTLVVSKLDRLARNTVEGIQIVEELFKRGVAVHVLNLGLLENTSYGKFFLTTLLAVAEMERNTILERTQAGKEIAKQKPNYREGRPKVYSPKQIAHALLLLDEYSYTQVAQLTGISKATLVRANRSKKE